MAARQVVVGEAALATLTGVELFGALAHANLTRARLSLALEALQSEDGDPALALAALRFLQAAALELARRDPGSEATWEDAQGWEVTVDTSNPITAGLEEERRQYRVQGALATGLAPDVVEDLPVADVDAFVKRGAR